MINPFEELRSWIGRQLCPNDPPPLAHNVKVSVVTSCTNDKKYPIGSQRVPLYVHLRHAHEGLEGQEHLRAMVDELALSKRPAEEMYTGQQHARLMKAVYRARETRPVKVDLKIVSAGWGFLDGKDPIVPYNCSFHDMGKRELHEWSARLGLKQAFSTWLKRKHELKILMLGDLYLEAVGVSHRTEFPSPTIMLCSPSRAYEMSRVPNVFPVGLGTKEATAYSCGVIAVKGEIASRLLNALIDDEDFRGRVSFALSQDRVVPVEEYATGQKRTVHG